MRLHYNPLNLQRCSRMPAHTTFDRLLARAQYLRAAEPRGRYAPSPTGPLHLGNLRTALLAWLQTRLGGGTFILRIEDLDRPRNRPGGTERILEDLRWLGIDWDEGPDRPGPCDPYVQSQRQALYDAAFARLRAAERLFPCFCSRKDIVLAASAPHVRDGSVVYPGTCRTRAPHATAPDVAWRYRVASNTVEVKDETAGLITQAMDRDVGDFVVRRADGIYAYQLAVVVDDALMGITDVVRGADLLGSTPRQVELFRALGLAPPRFWHVPLLLDEQGRRLAKRDHAAGVDRLRAGGITPAAIIGRWAFELGWIRAPEPISAAELREELTLDVFRARLAEVCRFRGAVEDA